MNLLETFKRIVNNIIIRQLILAGLLFIVIILFTLVWLKVYTNHNKTIKTPDLYGMQMEEALDVLHDYKLKFEITDSVYQVESPKGSIVLQSPSAGMGVKKNRTIHLVVNASNPEKVRVPNVVGVSLRQAKSELERYNLYVGRIKYRPDMAKHNVLDQLYKGRTIKPGEKVIKGSSIDLVLGDGYGSRHTNTPDLSNLHLRDVKKTIPLSYLNIGKITYSDNIKNFRDSINAVVVKQNPKPSVGVNMGSNVSIWLDIPTKNN